MNKFLAIAAAAVVGMGSFAMAQVQADKKVAKVNVNITVEKFAEIQLPSGYNMPTASYTGSGGAISTLDFSVLANCDYSVVATPDAWLPVDVTGETGTAATIVNFGKVVSGANELGYFMMMYKETAPGVFGYAAGLPYILDNTTLGTVSVSGFDTDKAATGSMGKKNFQVKAGGTPDRVANRKQGAMAAPGTYSGTATLTVILK